MHSTVNKLQIVNWYRQIVDRYTTCPSCVSYQFTLSDKYFNGSPLFQDRLLIQSDWFNIWNHLSVGYFVVESNKTLSTQCFLTFCICFINTFFNHIHSGLHETNPFLALICGILYQIQLNHKFCQEKPEMFSHY